MSKNTNEYDIELLPDIQYNKNIKTRRIVIVPKRAEKLLKVSDIKKFYDTLLQDNYKPKDISIQALDAFGEHLTVKGYNDDNINFKDDYAVDRVKDNAKFQVATKVKFSIHI